MESPSSEEARIAKQTELRRMKQVATGLLLLMTLIFIIARLVEPQYHWAGAIRAFAEAAMVGALADWFAVTALFRHPLGLPIPHTNLIATNQQRIGSNLGQFVTGNFLADRVIREKIDNLQVSIGVANWLRDPENSLLVVQEVVRLIPEALNGLDDEQINAQLKNKVTRLVREVDMGDIASDALQYFVQQGHHEIMLDKGIAMLREYLQKPDNREWIKQKMTEPNRFLSITDRFLKSIEVTPIADRIIDATDNFLGEIAADPQHRLRGEYNQMTAELIHNLRHSDDYKAKIEELQNSVLQSETLTHYTDNIWTRTKNEVIKNLQSEHSKIRHQIHNAITSLGEKVATNPDLQQQIDVWLKRELLEIVQNNRTWIAEHISNVVGGWDKDQVGDIIETEVGKDLQFIRINGTLVGGTVGLLIYIIFELIG